MIPKKIKVSCYDYKLKKVKNLKHDGKSLWGLCDRDNHIISLDAKIDNQRTPEVILHEILHAIEDAYGVHLGEKKVNILGMALAALFKDNPKLKELI